MGGKTKSPAKEKQLRDYAGWITFLAILFFIISLVYFLTCTLNIPLGERLGGLFGGRS